MLTNQNNWDTLYALKKNNPTEDNFHYINREHHHMNIRFNINTQKAVETVLWVIERGESNVYNIMKILFAADKFHLNKHGRPVTGDRYVAMEFGTVPSWIYDATKLKESKIGFIKKDMLLEAEPRRKANMELMSESDIEALEHGFNEYAKLSFKRVLEKNHKERAWILARERSPLSEAPDMLFEDMIDEKWLVDDLSEMSQFVVI